MALLGKAAMLLWYDIPAAERAGHDDWHTHEHMPERLGIPGFVRGSRWACLAEGPRYFAMYEVAELNVLVSLRYLERLNNPTPWTTQTMAHFRGMCRGFCKLTGSAGFGLGQSGFVFRLKPAPGRQTHLRDWLKGTELAKIAAKPGVASAHLFESGLTPPMTGEQALRGKDATVDWALVVTGYDADSVAAVAHDDLAHSRLEAQGAAPGCIAAAYRMDYLLNDGESAPA